jgi:hypothetical protein
MPETGHRSGLALKASQEFGVINQIRTQNFDRHIAIELWMITPVDPSHPAAPQRFQDPVFA